MRPLMVVELEIFFQALFCITYAVVGLKTNHFILDAAAETFNKDVVTPAAIRTRAGSTLILLRWRLIKHAARY